MDRNGKRTVLIAGGGVAALEAALALRELASERVNVELLAPDPSFSYRPLSVAVPFGLADVSHFELPWLAREIGAGFTLGGLTGIDEWRHVAHTSTNTEIAYDMLLVACGAVPFPAIPGADTFRGPADTALIGQLLEELLGGEVSSVAFVVPWGAVWSLPIYELALLTSGYLSQRGVAGVELTVVTPEPEPLQLFGAPASAAMRELLDERGVTLRPAAYARRVSGSELELASDDSISADRFIALARLQGAPLDGLPQTVHGFIPVDAHCRVAGVADVFAAGDITSFTVKQGGIATQQADAAADAIAAAAGAGVTPRRFHPILRGLLLTGAEPRYFRREVDASPMHGPVASHEPLWWPPAKIVGLHLAPFLASLSGVDAQHDLVGPPVDAVSVEVELGMTPDDEPTWSRPVFDARDTGEERVDELMTADPIVVAPEDTLGEVAEHLLEHGETAAVVAEYGRLIGIVTTGDLVRACAARVQPSEGRVRQWMTVEPVTIPVGSAPAAAAQLMLDYAIHHLPVIDGERTVGMLHLDDALAQRDALSVGLGF